MLQSLEYIDVHKLTLLLPPGLDKSTNLVYPEVLQFNICDGTGTPAINPYCSITVLSLRTTSQRGKEEKSEREA